MSFLKKGFTLIEILIVLTMIGIFVGATAYLTKDARIDQTKAERLAININDTIKNARNNMVIGRGVFSGASLYPTTERTIHIESGRITTNYNANGSTGTETDVAYPFFDNDGQYQIIDISVSSGVVNGTQMINWDHTGVTTADIVVSPNGSMQIFARKGAMNITDINTVRITAGYGIFYKSVILDRIVGRSEVVVDGGESTFNAAPPANSCSSTLPLCNGIACSLANGTPGSVEQLWIKDATSCGYTCINGYTGSNCEIPPAFSCLTPDPSFSYIGTLTYFPTGVNQAWTYSAVPGSCTYSCTTGYSGSGCLTPPSNSCDTPDPSFPNLGTLTYSPSSVSQTWVYGASSCGYTCTVGYTGTGCATATPTVTGFTTTWQVGTAGYGNADNTVQFTVTLGGSPMIDWGDGTIESIIFTTPSHTYTNPGTYTIKMSGITGFAQYGFGSNYHGKLTTVTSWGGIAWTDVQYMFYRANRLTTVPALAPDLSNIVDVTGMFQGASQFNSPIGSWDVSGITNMGFMFGGAFLFNQDISSWDVSNVTNMAFMFSSATAFAQDISSWDVGNVTNMNGLFQSADSFDQDISSWDVSSVTSMSQMFDNADIFNQDISNWCVPLIGTKPANFDTSANVGFAGITAKQPQWGTCPSTNSCESPDPSFPNIGVLTYAPSSVNQSWNYGASSCGYTCTGGYSGSGCATAPANSCESPDPSFPNIGVLTYAPSSVNQSWNYGASSCGYTCTGGYSGSGCATAPSVTGFTTTWRVGTATYGNANNTVQFNVTLSGTSMIDWGDGTAGVNVSTSPSHTYAAPGDYTIKISGIRTFSNFGGNSNYHGKLISVDDWGGIVWTNMTNMFAYANRLNSPLPATAPNMTNVTSMSAMFQGASLFNQSVANFDTSNVTNMSNIFAQATAFNSSLSSWNTSNVTNMSSMFQQANAFNQSVANFDTAKVTNMANMFNSDTAFNQSVSSFDTAKVTNMSYMFAYASQFNQPVSSFNTSLVTDMSYMFQSAVKFNQSVSSFNTSKVTNMANMFANAQIFNQSVSSFNTSLVTNMSAMFANAYAFNQSVSSFNTSNVTNMSQMFETSAFNQSVSNFDTSKVTNMSRMFYVASNFNQPLTNFDTSKVTDMSWMFRYASNFNQPLTNFDTSKVTNMSVMFAFASAFNQNISNWCVPLIASKPSSFDASANAGFAGNATKQPSWGTCPVNVTGFTTTWRVGTATYGNGNNTVQFNLTLSGTSMIDWGDGTAGINVSTSPSHTYAAPGDYTIKISGITAFSNFGGNANYHGKLLAVNDWGGIVWSDMAYMFLLANHLNSLPIAAPNMTSVTSMLAMFSSATVFNQSISNFNTSNVTNMAAMFESATAFNQSVSSFDTSKVTNMAAMFRFATAFNQPVSNFDTSKVTNMMQMFQGASGFNQSLASFNTSKVTNMSDMFWNATNFNGSVLNFNTSLVTNMTRMFYYASAFNQSVSSFNTSNVITMDSMFGGTTVFNQSVANFNTTKVTDMSWMFDNAKVFNQSVSSFNTSNVTNMAAMFQQAAAFNQSVANFNTTKVTDMSWMFAGAKAFNQSLASFNTANVTSMSYMFNGATAFNQSLASFNTSKVTTMQNMFSLASAFNQPVSNFDTSKVTNMAGMFQNASAFNQDISSWNTANVTIMVNAFNSATGFNQNLSSWVVNPKVTNCVNFSTSTPTWAQPKPTFSNCTP